MIASYSIGTVVFLLRGDDAQRAKLPHKNTILPEEPAISPADYPNMRLLSMASR